MKIAIVTDAHFGYKNDSALMMMYFERFYKEIFFPYIDKHEIKQIIDLGDTFDDRKKINYETLSNSKRVYFDEIAKRGIQVNAISGNHTTFYKNSSKINSIRLLLKEYDNVKVYEDPVDLDFDGAMIALIPWINSGNEEKFKEFLLQSKSPIAMGHLEIKGLEVFRGIKSEEGMDSNIFSQFQKVYSGHFHQKNDNGHIYYLGSHYDMSFSDLDETKGFHVYDTTTRTMEFIKNPYKLFYKVIYDDLNNDYKQLPNFDHYKGVFLKLVIKNKKNGKMFDKFLTALYAAAPADLTILDEADIVALNTTDDNVDVSEDTLNIIYKHIDENSEIKNPNKLKHIMNELYSESFDVE